MWQLREQDQGKIDPTTTGRPFDDAAPHIDVAVQ